MSVASDLAETKWNSIHTGDVIASAYPRICAHTFLRRGIRPGGVVIDLGANEGYFSHVMQSRFASDVIAVEPNPALIEAMPAVEGLRTVQAAISGEDGTTILHVSADSEASTIDARGRNAATVGSIEVPMLTLPTLMRRFGIGEIDLLKVDIEGQELGLFDSMSDGDLKAITQMSVEFHAFCGLLPQAEVDRIKARLSALNFLVIDFSREDYDVLCVNLDRCPVSAAEAWYLKTVLRNVRGAIRAAAT